MKITLLFFSILVLIALSVQVSGQWAFSGNNIYNTNSGNVGVGNNIPGSLLYVGKIMTEPTITVRNFGGTGGATYSMIDDASGANWKFKATNSGGFKIRDHANSLDVITIEANSAADAIYINSAGNVGIRTTVPGAYLNVANTNLAGLGSTGSFQIGLSNSYNLVCDNNEIQSRLNGGVNTLFLQYWGGNLNACASGGTASFNGPVYMASNLEINGRIGIHTPPSYDLHVESTDYTAAHFFSPYNGGTVMNIIAAGTTAGTWGLYSSAVISGYAAYFSGNVYCTGSYLPSDEKLKENIQPLDNVLDELMKLDINTYYFKQEFAEMNLPTSRQYGFTAQNLENVFPELIKLNPAKGKEQPIEFKAVNYIGLIPILTEAIQEQQKEMEAKESRIDDLQRQVDDLKALVLAIQQGK
jgi:hypothetical protein